MGPARGPRVAKNARPCLPFHRHRSARSDTSSTRKAEPPSLPPGRVRPRPLCDVSARDGMGNAGRRDSVACPPARRDRERLGRLPLAPMSAVRDLGGIVSSRCAVSTDLSTTVRSVNGFCDAPEPAADVPFTYFCGRTGRSSACLQADCRAPRRFGIRCQKGTPGARSRRRSAVTPACVAPCNLAGRSQGTGSTRRSALPRSDRTRRSPDATRQLRLQPEVRLAPGSLRRVVAAEPGRLRADSTFMPCGWPRESSSAATPRFQRPDRRRPR